MNLNFTEAEISVLGTYALGLPDQAGERAGGGDVNRGGVTR